MRLRRIRFDAYRHFLGQRLDLNADVTVIVGRNDTGKTGVLNDFMRDVYGQWMIGTDTPQLPGVVPAPNQKYSLDWQMDEADELAVRAAFDVTERAETLTADFDAGSRPMWTYRINGNAVTPVETFKHRGFFPAPAYVHVAGPDGPRDRLLPYRFAAQFTPISGDQLEVPSYPDPIIPVEGVMARLAGFASHTRRLPGPGADDPWENSFATPGPAVAALNEAFRPVAAAINEQLRRWWREPNDVEFRISVVGSEEQNSYWVTCDFRTENGLTTRGVGVRWFVAMGLELLFIRALKTPHLLLFDEPGSPLHPSAQRSVTRLLQAFAAESGSQLIYSTHSPFMIDWSFPQRVRLFERDFATGKGTIINDPYHPRSPFSAVWDPLRATIGVTLGDLSYVGELNVFVEGITDQIILANASAHAEARGLPHLDLPRTSIVPYSDHQMLDRLIQTAAAYHARSIATIDTDRSRRVGNVKQLQQAGIACLSLDQFSDTATANAAIEDVIGVEDYVASVNRAYQDFDWFSPLDVTKVRSERGSKTLGRYLAEVFDQTGQNFSKVLVATEIVSNFDALGPAAWQRLDRLIAELARTLDG